MPRSWQASTLIKQCRCDRNLDTALVSTQVYAGSNPASDTNFSQTTGTCRGLLSCSLLVRAQPASPSRSDGKAYLPDLKFGVCRVEPAFGTKLRSSDGNAYLLRSKRSVSGLVIREEYHILTIVLQPPPNTRTIQHVISAVPKQD